MRIMELDISSHVYPADVTVSVGLCEHIVEQDVVRDVKVIAEALSVSEISHAIKDVSPLPFAIFRMRNVPIGLATAF